MSIKMLREDLCRRQVQADQWPSDIASAVDVLINMIDRHRPLGQDGTHGGLHTSTCGCKPLSRPATTPCCPGDGSMAHVRGCINHPEADHG